jgi:hypothetical protein
MSAMHRGLLRSGSPSSMLKLQKRTLPWGWYFTDLAMQGYRRWGWGVVWERRGGVALLQGDNTGTKAVHLLSPRGINWLGNIRQFSPHKMRFLGTPRLHHHITFIGRTRGQKMAYDDH